MDEQISLPPKKTKISLFVFKSEKKRISARKMNSFSFSDPRFIIKNDPESIKFLGVLHLFVVVVVVVGWLIECVTTTTTTTTRKN